MTRSRKKLIKGFSLAKSNEYSINISDLFFDDPDSVSAKKFQDCNSILKGFWKKMQYRLHHGSYGFSDGLNRTLFFQKL